MTRSARSTPDLPPSGRRGPIDRGAAAALVTLASAQVALFAYYVHVNLILQPYWDMYSHVMRYLRYTQDGALWAYLWTPHVQHRHVWMRLLTWFDVEVFSGVGYPFVIAAVLCQSITAWLLWREVRHGSPAALRLPGGSLAVMLVLTAVSAVDCATPINAIYPQVVMLSVAAVVLFDAGGRDDASRTQAWRRVLAWVFAVCAAFANTVALALWPILVWLAWRGRAGHRWIAGTAVLGIVFVAAFVRGLPLGGEGSNGGGVLMQFDYLVTYLGLPWTRAAALAVPGRLLGALLLVSALGSAIRYGLVGRATTRMQRIAVALILFSLSSAVLAAAGRSGVDGDVLVPVRYAVLVAPLHVGLLMLALPHLADRRARVASRVAVAAAAALVVQQVAAGEAAGERTRSMRALIDRFVAGETHPDMRAVVYEDLSQARRELDAIRAAGWYLDAR